MQQETEALAADLDAVDLDIADLQELEIKSVTATWTNADLKAGTALTLLPAQGAGTIIVPVSIYLKLNYGGNSAFTNSRTISAINPVNGMSPGAAFWQATADAIATGLPVDETTGASFALLSNINYVLTLSGGLLGNPDNDNTVTVKMRYYIMQF